MNIIDFTGNISVNCDYPLQEFLNLPEVPCQRNTEARLSRARKYLKHVRPEHCVVHLVRLKKDCEVVGKIYRKGQLFRNDGNTRALNWSQNGSKDPETGDICVPEKLVAIIYEYDDMEQIRKAYDCFDSSEATERTQQKVYGTLQDFYSYTPKSEKLISGTIITGLNKACHFIKPDEWNQTNIRDTKHLRDELSYWMMNGCLQALDELMNRKDKWNQVFITAALMSLRHYGPKDQKLRHAWSLIERGCANTNGKEWDGVTHIVDEWKTGTFFKDPRCKIHTDTRWDNMDRTVSYILYWIDKYMEDELGCQVGKGWDTTGQQYRHRKPYNSVLHDLITA